eukprot:c11495_g1_i1.p1 GENE.c11495_g1_i1~~c11495_g1_i1.p1  ORF type:complete len:585 (-),score=79.09 c11495_g1_i1:96-1703(-)
MCTIIFIVVSSRAVQNTLYGLRIDTMLASASLFLLFLLFVIEFDACGVPAFSLSALVCAAVFVPVGTLCPLSTTLMMCFFLPHVYLLLTCPLHVFTGLLVLPAQVSYSGWGGWLDQYRDVDAELLKATKRQMARDLSGESVNVLTCDNVLLDGMLFTPNPSSPWLRATPAHPRVRSPLPISPTRSTSLSVSLLNPASPSEKTAVLRSGKKAGYSAITDRDITMPRQGTEPEQEQTDEAGETASEPASESDNGNGRYVLMFNGNNQAYEFKDDDIRMFVRRGYSVLAFNYRGVGASQGRVTRDGLLLDGEAWYQYLVCHRKVPNSKICLYGTSLGASFASILAAAHPGVVLVNDRSFSSLATEVVHAGPYIFGYETPSLRRSVLGTLLRALVCFGGWDLPVASVWPSIRGPKCIIHHSKDLVIPEPARLITALTSPKRSSSPLSLRFASPLKSDLGSASSPGYGPPEVSIVSSGQFSDDRDRTWVLRMSEGEFEYDLVSPDEYFRIAHCRAMTETEQRVFFETLGQMFAKSFTMKS